MAAESDRLCSCYNCILDLFRKFLHCSHIADQSSITGSWANGWCGGSLPFVDPRPSTSQWRRRLAPLCCRKVSSAARINNCFCLHSDQFDDYDFIFWREPFEMRNHQSCARFSRHVDHFICDNLFCCQLPAHFALCYSRCISILTVEIGSNKANSFTFDRLN